MSEILFWDKQLLPQNNININKPVVRIQLTEQLKDANYRTLANACFCEPPLCSSKPDSLTV
jgi:hypothetical protein